MIAITLVAGAAAFGFVNGQATEGSQAVATNAAKNINYLNEREVLTLVTQTDTTNANAYVYNNGGMDPESIVSIQVYQTDTPSPVCTITLAPMATVGLHTVEPIAVDLASCSWAPSGSFYFPAISPPHTPVSFTFVVIGQYGSQAQLTVGF